jgi:hypothetical protein
LKEVNFHNIFPPCNEDSNVNESFSLESQSQSTEERTESSGSTSDVISDDKSLSSAEGHEEDDITTARDRLKVLAVMI